MVPPGAERSDAGRAHPVVEGLDLGDGPVELVHAFYVHVPEIGGLRELVRTHAGLMVLGAHQRGLVPEVPGPVSGAGPVGDRAVEGDADQPDVDVGPVLVVLEQRATQEGGHSRVAGQVLLAPRRTALVGDARGMLVVVAHWSALRFGNIGQGAGQLAVPRGL